MAETSELNAAQDASQRDPATGPGAPISTSEIAALEALAAFVSADPTKLPRLLSECRTRLQAASAKLKSCGQSRMLPLLTELERSLDALAPAPGENARTAIAAALKMLNAALSRGIPPPPAREMVAIGELRGMRGAPAPWRDALIDSAGEFPAAAEAAAGSGDELRPEIISRVLGAFRKSLLRFLKADSTEEAKTLSRLCKRVAEACDEAAERRRWQAAVALFTCVSGIGGSPRPLVKRLAVKLEQALRSLSENARVNEQNLRSLTLDLEVVTALLRKDSGAAEPEAMTAHPLRTDADAFATALRRLSDTPQDRQALLGRIADGFLVNGDYDHWLEACELADQAESMEAVGAAVARWTAAALESTEPGSESNVPAQFAHVQATLSRIEGALQPGGGTGDGQGRISGISVDEMLLENLNLAAREIRGARSRAEANLGSLRGGLGDMERSINTLRSQLESLEAESHAHGSGRVYGSKSEASVRSKFGALSKGIEELAGLKEALEAVTEQTESALAAQAGEDVQLEQGLLRTRMMPIGACFEALRRGVERAASASGRTATLSACGADVALERRRVDALGRALESLLEACVREGLPPSMLEDRTNPVDRRLNLEVHQPRCDVRVDICYRGAPLSDATLARLAPPLEALGGAVTRSEDADGKARVRVTVPGPPRPMDLLLVEAGKSRFALPLKEVCGVSRRLKEEVVPDGNGGQIRVEKKVYHLTSLADVLRLETARTNGSAFVLVERDEARLACRVDSVIGRARMLVQSAGPLLSTNPWVLGVVVDLLAAPTLVLDLSGLETSVVSEPA